MLARQGTDEALSAEERKVIAALQNVQPSLCGVSVFQQSLEHKKRTIHCVHINKKLCFMLLLLLRLLGKEKKRSVCLEDFVFVFRESELGLLSSPLDSFARNELRPQVT